MKSERTQTTLQTLHELSRGLVILLTFLALGELLMAWAGWPIPGNVVGMVLLTIALLTRLVRLQWVAAAADALLSRLGLFFVPPGVGVMLYFDLIGREWLPLLGALLGSSVAVLWVTAAIATLLERHPSGKEVR
jgi:holin-like protein